MIRKCTLSDLESIILLENECFKSPLSRETLSRDLNSNPLSNYLCYEENGIVKGYIGLWLTDIGSIINFAVTENSRRLGIGKKLIEETINVFNNNNINEISLDVRESNIVALSLYKKYNFKEVYVRRNYYENKENAIVMVRSNV